MNSITSNPQQDNPRKMSQLEYARMIEAAHGPQAPVTWLCVGDLIALLVPHVDGVLETDQAQAYAVTFPAEVTV